MGTGAPCPSPPSSKMATGLMVAQEEFAGTGCPVLLEKRVMWVEPMKLVLFAISGRDLAGRTEVSV